jgi:translation initiation factor IF-2
MRMTKAQINHKPFVVLYNTMAKEYKQVFIPTKPAKVVFDLKKLEEDKEHDEKIEAFVKGLNEHKDMGLSFQDNLREYGKKNKVDKKIMMIIEEAMNESDSQGID